MAVPEVATQAENEEVKTAYAVEAACCAAGVDKAAMLLSLLVVVMKAEAEAEMRRRRREAAFLNQLGAMTICLTADCNVSQEALFKK